jgi:uncharacterized membrane protein YiaA
VNLRDVHLIGHVLAVVLVAVMAWLTVWIVRLGRQRPPWLPVWPSKLTVWLVALAAVLTLFVGVWSSDLFAYSVAAAGTAAAVVVYATRRAVRRRHLNHMLTLAAGVPRLEQHR